MITTEAVTDKDIVDNIIAARNNETEEDEDKEVKETTEPPKKKPTQQTVDAAFEVIHDWIEMTEDTKDIFFSSYQKIHRPVNSAHVRASVLLQSTIIVLLSDCTIVIAMRI